MFVLTDLLADLTKGSPLNTVLDTSPTTPRPRFCGRRSRKPTASLSILTGVCFTMRMVMFLLGLRGLVLLCSVNSDMRFDVVPSCAKVALVQLTSNPALVFLHSFDRSARFRTCFRIILSDRYLICCAITSISTTYLTKRKAMRDVNTNPNPTPDTIVQTILNLSVHNNVTQLALQRMGRYVSKLSCMCSKHNRLHLPKYLIAGN